MKPRYSIARRARAAIGCFLMVYFQHGSSLPKISILIDPLSSGNTLTTARSTNGDLFKKAATETPEHRAWDLDARGLVLLRQGRISASIHALNDSVERLPQDNAVDPVEMDAPIIGNAPDHRGPTVIRHAPGRWNGQLKNVAS